VVVGYWYSQRCHEDFDSIYSEIIGKIHATPTMCGGSPALWTTEFDEEVGVTAWAVGPGCTGESVIIRAPWPLVECESNDPFRLTTEQGAQIAVAIIVVWALAYAIRMFVRTLNIDEKGEVS